jgi:nicotinamidase/pyrazinamidase
MAERIDLVIIDPQNDFCDPKTGTLFVPGADKDMVRLSDLIKRKKKEIKKIHVTLDCHYLIDIAHPQMWVNSKGDRPSPFTIITSNDIKSGVWFPVYPQLRQKFTEYCESLEEGGRYPLCIWPPHCLIGSSGNAVYPPLYESLVEWQEERGVNVNWVSKGSNIFTEHYSAVKAEVPDPADPSTQLNTSFLTVIGEADRIWLAGEAGSHCLKNTVEDIADGFSDYSYISKMELITDCTSPVLSPAVDFPAIQSEFIKNMKTRGMKTFESTEL